MTRNQRVINAFFECVRNGTFSKEYAEVLIENHEAYGFLSEKDKEAYYEEVDAWEQSKKIEDMQQLMTHPEDIIPPLIESDLEFAVSEVDPGIMVGSPAEPEVTETNTL